MTDKRCAHGWINHADCEVCALLAERDQLREQVKMLRVVLGMPFALWTPEMEIVVQRALAATEPTK